MTGCRNDARRLRQIVVPTRHRYRHLAVIEVSDIDGAHALRIGEAGKPHRVGAGQPDDWATARAGRVHAREFAAIDIDGDFVAAGLHAHGDGLPAPRPEVGNYKHKVHDERDPDPGVDAAEALPQISGRHV